MSAINRREVLLGLGGTGLQAVAAQAKPPAPRGTLPQVKLGPHRVSRLIVGGNPVSGNSHFSGQLSREMTDYFTAANVKKLLRECELAGINTWQSRGDRHITRLLHEYRQEGGSIRWIAQTASELADQPRHVRELAGHQPLGIYHHGSRTDRLWQAGQIEQARDLLKVIRDAGVQVGLGTHIPEVIDYVESKTWDVDFYMTCVYNLSRPRQEAEQLAGRTVQEEFFWDPDREKMLARVRQTAKPCLIFKVYAASRKCGSAEDMLAALRLALRYAKPSDAVVIGMFPKRTEQVRENCRLIMEAIKQSPSA